jgi:hypothetical protein
MDTLLAAISKNPFNKECVAHFTNTTADMCQLKTEESLWNGYVRSLTPARLTTAWLMLEDPLMILAGPAYRATEVRDKSFALQEEAMTTLRGNRKLPKVKMGDALSSLKPTVDQTKVIARILLALKHIQTVCFDETTKTVWTMPEDLRAWSPSLRTLWVDSRCERYLDFSESRQPNLGQWLSDRESESWTIEWPVSEDSYEDMKRIVIERGLQVKPADGATKAKKDDYAKVLGRVYAIDHLFRDSM